MWTDIATGNWIDIYLPVYARPYARLMRLDRPIGTWLLLLPCLWGISIAGGRFPNVGLMILFVLGSVVMRSAGCVVNDIYDRNLDALVERTSKRPLPSGDIKLWQAILLLILLLCLGFGILCFLNPTAILMGLSSAFLVFSYPLMKRITWWPQLFLGFTFNWGVLVGVTAVTSSVSLPAILLYVGGIFWTLGYDTIYAHQDKRDDSWVGIKSTALLLGDNSRPWVTFFYVLAFLLIMFAGRVSHLGYAFYVVLAIAAGLAAVHLGKWRLNDPADCLERFRANRDIGIAIWFAIMFGKII